MHNYLGSDGMAPSDLLTAGRAEVRRYGVELLHDEVLAARRESAGFAVELADGRSVGGRRVLVAAGLVDELPALPGARELWGRDVLHCPTATAGRCATSPSACWAPARCRCTRR